MDAGVARRVDPLLPLDALPDEVGRTDGAEVAWRTRPVVGEPRPGSQLEVVDGDHGRGP